MNNPFNNKNTTNKFNGYLVLKKENNKKLDRHLTENIVVRSDTNLLKDQLPSLLVSRG